MEHCVDTPNSVDMLFKGLRRAPAGMRGRGRGRWLMEEAKEEEQEGEKEEEQKHT